jgi:hypothetical protein
MSMAGDKADEVSTGGSDQTADQSSWTYALDASDAKPVEWEKLLEVGSVADLFGTHKGEPMVRYLRLGDGTLAFKGASSGVSRRSAPARAGQLFRATATITATGEGDPVPAHFGPMFLNARDEVLLYSLSIPIAAFDEEQQIDVQAVAPPGTVAVRLRLVGSWAADKDTSKITCTYGAAALFRAKAE